MADAHEIAQRTSLLHHQLYAVGIEHDRSRIDRARDIIRNEIRLTGGTVGERMWERLLEQPWSRIREQMLEDSPEGRLLRSNSPFSIVIGMSEPGTRRRIWRQAKHDLSTAAT